MIYLLARFNRRSSFRAMIAYYLGYIHAAQFVENICSSAPGNNDAWIQRSQTAKQIARVDAHASLIRMLDNGRQSPIKVERAQGPLLGEPRHNREGSFGKKIVHRQVAEPTFVRSARRPVTRS